jgi:uncharacterized protein YjbI with pentapeptide repeats
LGFEEGEMKHTYDFDNILEQYQFKSKNELFGYLRKNTRRTLVNLRGANLSYADLRGVDLRGVNLSYADLRGVDLSYVNLSYVNLRGVDLSYVNLRDVNLRDVDLSYANLRGVDLRGVDLSYANLRGVDLRGANLSYADLRGVDLSYANLRGAKLDFSCLSFSCRSLRAVFDQKHIIQILYHAAIPTQNNKLEVDQDIVKLFNSAQFKKVVNKFHRVKEDCEAFKKVRE